MKQWKYIKGSEKDFEGAPDWVTKLIEVWDGEGLPPVGTICEWLASGDHDWVKVTVLGHNGDDTWLKPDDGTQSFVVGNAENFRPLPNEREKAIQEMRNSVTNYNNTSVIHAIEQIYDAGYRKYAAQPGFEWRYVCECCGCRVEPGQELYHGCDL